jgi:hypothetical protein
MRAAMREPGKGIIPAPPAMCRGQPADKGMVQTPRPWVAATRVPLGSTRIWLTTTWGRLVPSLSQVVPLSVEV